jgi:Surp module
VKGGVCVFNQRTAMEEGLTSHVSLIYPPPELRKIIDKTSDFVARNGYGFEERIREKEGTSQCAICPRSFEPLIDYNNLCCIRDVVSVWTRTISVMIVVDNYTTHLHKPSKQQRN